MARGIFGSMFDMNRDGKMNAWERAMEMAFLEDLEKEDNDSDFDDLDEFDEDFDDADNF